MLNESQFLDYVNMHGISGLALEYLMHVRKPEASRMVGENAINSVTSFDPSEKMNCSISAESSMPESGFGTLCNYNKTINEHWDQPGSVIIKRTMRNGATRNQSYTPDALVLGENGMKVIEVKHETEIARLLNKRPEDWILNEAGEPEYLPAKKAFQAIGIVFEVFVYKTEHLFLVENIKWLMATRKVERYPALLVNKANKILNGAFACSLSNLKEALKLDSYTSLIQLIDDGHLKACLDKELLSMPESCYVALSGELLNQARDIIESQKVHHGFSVSDVPVSHFPPNKVAAAILKKLERVNGGEDSRSVRRWRRLIEKGEQDKLSSFQSLIPRYYKCGRVRSQINAAVEDYLNKYIRVEHAERQGISTYQSYNNYKVSAEKIHPAYTAVSIKTFRKRLKQTNPMIIAYKRGGKRSANAVAPPTDPLQRRIKSRCAWERAAIDHFKADIYLVFFSSTNEVFVQKPWISVMIDIYTSCILAVAISFSDPSRRSDAKLIRECVRRHGRLPMEIITDRGSDFTSVYFSSLLAHYTIRYTLRPAGHPRFGGEIEGFFLEMIRAFLCQRKGNDVGNRNPRSIDGNKMPKKAAITTPASFYKELMRYCDWHDNKVKRLGDTTPTELFKKSQEDFPFIGVPVEYNSEFMLVTAVESKEYKVDFSKGIHVKNMWYSSPDMEKVRGKISKLEVRLDPENPHVIYALINKEWQSLYSASANSFSAKNKAEQIADCLIDYEAVGLKLLVKEEQDLEWVRILREMDKGVKQDAFPLMRLDNVVKEGKELSIYEKIKRENIQSIHTGTWGAK